MVKQNPNGGGKKYERYSRMSSRHAVLILKASVGGFWEIIEEIEWLLIIWKSVGGKLKFHLKGQRLYRLVFMYAAGPKPDIFRWEDFQNFCMQKKLDGDF